jgi:hypothetical protein
MTERIDARTRQLGAIASVEARLALLGPPVDGEPATRTVTRRRLLGKLDELNGGVPPDEAARYEPPVRERRDVDG